MAEQTDFFRYRYLMGAMSQNQLSTTVRLACIEDDVSRLPEIVKAWRAASARMVTLTDSEPGLPETIVVESMPEKWKSKIETVNADPLFQASFSDLPTTFGVVEIDKLVAPQREVNLDYVELLRKRIPGKSVDDLVDFCVAARTEAPELKALQTAANQITFSSRSLDLRFLGGFPKQIGEDDVKVAHMGGQPAEVITLLIGFGAAPIHAYQVGKRIVLANGFHRVVAMRTEGISKAPIVLRQVANSEIEFPDHFLNLSRNYLLQQPRPVLVKDFFDPDLTVELRLKARKKTLKIMWGEEASVVPE
jgi:hypothetical protein